MKNQALFSSKDKSKKLKCCLLQFLFEALTFKVVICGKYKNLNKIKKIKDISLKFQRLLIFVILYSLQCKKEG